MAVVDKDKQELWVDWTHDAMEKYELPDKVDDSDELVEDMVDVTTKYADAMLEEFEERFSGGTARRRGSRKKKPELDSDDDDD